IDQELVEFADLAPGHHRKGEHVPERKTEIVDHHFLPRVVWPAVAERLREEPVDVARAGIKIDSHRQPIHEAVDAPREAGGHRLPVAADIFDVVRRRRLREYFGDQATNFLVELDEVLALLQSVEAIVEPALEPIDAFGADLPEAFGIEHLV